MIDAIHHAAHVALNAVLLDAARELLAHNHVDRDPKFFTSLEAVLEVLPVLKAFSGIELEGDAAAQVATSRCRRTSAVSPSRTARTEPEQLDLWREEAGCDPPCQLPLEVEVHARGWQSRQAVLRPRVRYRGPVSTA